MNRAAHEGRTVVFVSHNLAALQRLCTRAVWIDKGVVRDVGQPTSVVASYLKSGGAKQVEGTAEVPKDAIRIGTGSARLRRISMLDEAGAPIDQLQFGQPVRLRLLYNVLRPIEDALIEVGISSADGERVVTVQSIDGGRPPLSLQPGDHEVEVLVDVTMLPGDFTIDAALHEVVGLTHDFVERVLTFTAVNIGYRGERWPWDTVRGFVRADSDWSFSQEPAKGGMAIPTIRE